MSKKRLEEIRNRMIVEKHYFKYLNSEKGYWENVYTLLEQDMNYLFNTIIEQAERVQELEEEVDRLNGALHYQLSQENIRNEENRKLKYKNKRHRKVLEFYADEENYCVRFEDDYEPILQDNGKTARQELGWEESE